MSWTVTQPWFRRFIERSAKRRSALVAVTALLAMSLPTFTMDRDCGERRLGATRNRIVGQRLKRVGRDGWSTSSSNADGLVHSNRDLMINGSSNAMQGGTEYARRLRVRQRQRYRSPGHKGRPG